MVHGGFLIKATAKPSNAKLQCRIFLGGLPGEATYAQIWQALTETGVDVRQLRLVYRQGRSRGFAFATLASATAAQRVIANGLMILGRKVDCRPAERQELDRPGSFTRKLYVGNIAPHASSEDLRDYFAAFGRVINVQLKYCTGRRPAHRGFCFVTFSQVEEALCVLSRVHTLFGRVLRVAKAEGQPGGSDVPVVNGPTPPGVWHWRSSALRNGYGIPTQQLLYTVTCSPRARPVAWPDYVLPVLAPNQARKTACNK